MPNYDYECQKCGHIFEVFQTMKEKRLTDCPKCKKGKVKRLLGTGAGIIFKGSGFYETDYKRKEGGSSGGGRPVSKPATKPEDKSASSKPAAKAKSED